MPGLTFRVCIDSVCWSGTKDYLQYYGTWSTREDGPDNSHKFVGHRLCSRIPSTLPHTATKPRTSEHGPAGGAGHETSIKELSVSG